MNIAKIQQEVLKQLIVNASFVTYFDTPDDTIFLTVDKKVGYLLPRDQLRLDLTGAQSGISLWGTIAATTQRTRNLLVETDEYRLGGKARKYLRSDDTEVEIYVDQTLLKNFDYPQLWQLPGNQEDVIVVTETFCSDGVPVPVGVVCPVRVNN